MIKSVRGAFLQSQSSNASLDLQTYITTDPTETETETIDNEAEYLQKKAIYEQLQQQAEKKLPKTKKEYEKAKKGWIARTVIDSAGVVGTTVGVIVHSNKIKETKADISEKQTTLENINTELDNLPKKNKRCITRNYSILMLLLPMYANTSGNYTIAIQQLDDQISKLRAQNQADIEKCEKNVKGFKIAGITTLSLTGVGVGVNIGQAVKLNKLKEQSTSLDSDITSQKAALDAAKSRLVEERTTSTTTATKPKILSIG